MKPTSFLAALALLVPVSAQTAKPFEYWPGAQYDSSIPTPKQVLGYEFGDRITWSANLVRYFETLAAAAPARMKVWEFAKSWEGRRLVYAAIGSEANIARLPEIQGAMKKLADPRKTSAAEAKRLIESMPTIVWLAYGVHGNEISSPDAAMVTAYHLLAARNDSMVASILANTVVILVPTQNPDGRDRFIHSYEMSEGLEPDSNPIAAEHTEDWPGGRTNHYFFDMNRDWLAFTQPEIKGQMRILLEWLPQVFVDLHEMGTDNTYYFTPEADPFNPHLTREQRTSLTWFGKNNAKYFDKFGFSYFTREVYDAFYPGYGASWPAYFGSLAVTYENGSTRGLIVKKSDESVIEYRTTVRRHFTTSLATCETAAMHRQELLDNFWKYHVTAVDEGSKEAIREYILPRRGNVSNVDRLAQLLSEQGVEVSRAKTAFGGYPAGSYVIPLAQPAKRLIRTFLDPVVSMDDKFVKAEEERRKHRRGSEIYDVTAWSVPLQFNVECIANGSPSQGSFELVTAEDWPKGSVTGSGSVAFLVPWGTNAAGRFLTAALRAGLRVYSSDKAFTLEGGRRFPAGSLILKAADNPADLGAKVAELAKSSGAEAVGSDTSWVDDGPNFGSRYVTWIRKIHIAMAWDRPTSAGSAGATRFVLERQFGYPVTVIRTQQLATADLTEFQVIILPDTGGGGYASILGANGARRLKDWVEQGGTLIGIGGGALQFMADPKNSLLSIHQENAVPAAPAAAPGGEKPAGGGTGTPAPDSARVPGKLLTKEEDLAKAIQPDGELPGSAHGILARVKVDQDLWLTVGVPETVNALVMGRSIFTPLKMDKGFNAASFAGPDQVLASGYIWDEYRKQLAFKPFAVVEKDGRGNLIGFTEDVNYRAYLDGLNLLFLNAVFRGPGH
ncbi:MAG TPA: M14 metallopeptidase family protein [Bryobacteraceae bacterium]|jgi:hypothetical protein